MKSKLKYIKPFIIVLIVLEMLVLVFKNTELKNDTVTVIDYIKYDNKTLNVVLDDLRKKGFSLETINEFENGYTIKVRTDGKLEEISSKLNELSEYNITDYNVDVSSGEAKMEVVISY